jgi:hypothetical protein
MVRTVNVPLTLTGSGSSPAVLEAWTSRQQIFTPH